MSFWTVEQLIESGWDQASAIAKVEEITALEREWREHEALGSRRKYLSGKELSIIYDDKTPFIERLEELNAIRDARAKKMALRAKARTQAQAFRHAKPISFETLITSADSLHARSLGIKLD